MYFGSVSFFFYTARYTNGLLKIRRVVVDRVDRSVGDDHKKKLKKNK
jgi:hypothetical protein